MTYPQYQGICFAKRYISLLFVLRGNSYLLLSPGSALKFGAPGEVRVSLREISTSTSVRVVKETVNNDKAEFLPYSVFFFLT